jgi:nicotinate-nucleotide adenylyltransferase
MRIGLLGGSFNPAHGGHRHISLEAMRALGLDEVWWLVSPGNPLKANERMAPYPKRLESARRAARRARIKVSDFEARAGTRFTVDTLRKLRRRWPNDRFIWLMGADSLRNFHMWKDWRGIAREVPIAVIARPGYDSRARAARAMGWLRRFVHPSRQANDWTEWSAPAILLLRLPPDPASSTAIREHDPNWHRKVRALPACRTHLRAPLSSRRPLDRTSH